MSNYTRLTKKFYTQNTHKVAQALLGKYIIRNYGKTCLVSKIIETESYYGPKDKASHASKGKTPRTELMFDQSGLAYIYLIYGMYYCFNIVTEKKDFPAAVLIRGVEPISGIKKMYQNRNISLTKYPKLNTKLTNGPGKFCQAYKIDKKLNGQNLITSQKLYLAKNPQEKIKPSQIKKAKRIGIDYAQEYKDKLWRYYL